MSKVLEPLDKRIMLFGCRGRGLVLGSVGLGPAIDGGGKLPQRQRIHLPGRVT